MYWLAFPFALLLFGGFAFEDLYGFRHGTDPTVEVASPANGDWGNYTTSEGTVGIPPH
jgi:hypothetical protein